MAARSTGSAASAVGHAAVGRAAITVAQRTSTVDRATTNARERDKAVEMMLGVVKRVYSEVTRTVAQTGRMRIVHAASM